MTTQQLYQKVISEQMTKTDFLWNVRRDNNLSSLITNTMSFDDTVKVLKGKGHIAATEEVSAVRPFDFIGAMRSLNEAATAKKKLAKKDLKKKKGHTELDADHVNYHEFTKGWKHELEHTDDIDVAKQIALDHLAEDPNYYTRLDMIEYQAKKEKKKDSNHEVKKGNIKDKENQMVPAPKKKAEPKTKKSLKESFAGLLPAKSRKPSEEGEELDFEKALKSKDIEDIATFVVDDIQYNNEKYHDQYKKAIADKLDDEEIDELNDQIDALLDRIGGFEGHEDDYHVEPKDFKSTAKRSVNADDLDSIDEEVAKDIEYKPNAEYIWKMRGREFNAGKLSKDDFDYLMSKEKSLEVFDYKDRAKFTKKEQPKTETDPSKDPTKFSFKQLMKKQDEPKKGDLKKGKGAEIEKDIDSSLSYNPDQEYFYRRENDKRGNSNKLDKDEFKAIKNDPKLLIFRKATEEDKEKVMGTAKGKDIPAEKAKETPEEKAKRIKAEKEKKTTTSARIKPEGETFSYELKPKNGNRSSIVHITKAEAEKRLNNPNFSSKYDLILKSDTSKDSAENKRKVVTTFAPGVKPNSDKPRKEKDRPTSDIKGITSKEPETDDVGSYVGVKRKSEPNLGVKRIKPTPSVPNSAKNWQVVDINDPRNPVVIGAFDDKSKARELKGDDPKILVLPPLSLKKIRLDPLSEEMDQDTKSEIEASKVSFVITDPKSKEETNVQDTVGSAQFNSQTNTLTINLSGGNKIEFNQDPGGAIHGTYFSGDEKFSVSDKSVLAPLSTAIKHVFDTKSKQEKPEPESPTLESYIRKRIQKAIKLAEDQYSDSGAYNGYVGKDVVKKKLKEYMARYEWGYQNSEDPAVRDRGQEVNGIVSKMVNALGDEGVKIFNDYAPEGYEIKNVDDLGKDSFVVGPGPQDRKFYPNQNANRNYDSRSQAAVGNGGRIAENMGDQDIINKAKAVMTNNYSKFDVKELGQEFGKFITTKGVDKVRNNKEWGIVISALHKLSDKHR